MNETELFDLLFRSYYQPLLVFAQQYVGDSDECRDIVSAVFEDLWRNFSRIDHQHMRAYLYTLVRNKCVDHLRHRLAARMDFAISSFHFKLGAAYRYREGQYVADGQRHDYGGVLLVDAGVERAFGPATLYLQAYNLLNVSYRDYGGVPQPGITATAGLRLGL